MLKVLVYILFFVSFASVSLANKHTHQGNNDNHNEEHTKKHTYSHSEMKWEYGVELEMPRPRQGVLRIGDADVNSRDHNLAQQWKDHHRNVRDLTNLLFPNQSIVPIEHRADEYHKLEQQNMHGRKEQTTPCVICRDMEYCNALNGYQIQEVYLPYNLNDLGTCRVLDALGEHVATEVFGNGRTFRNTKQCKDIVMQYLCLFYGSNNDMYENLCVFQEDVSDSNPINHKVAPRPPCRSFCVQVAEVCANDPKFMQLCYNIKCPPMEDSCTPDPKVEGQVLAANIGCDMPFDVNPYFKKNSAQGSYAFNGPLVVSLVALGVTLIWGL